MRDYAKITPKFWIGETGRQIKNLGIDAQLTALYLMTSPHANMIGVYYLPITFIIHETGLNTEAAYKALQSLCAIGFCSYDLDKEYIWIHEMAFYQISKNLKLHDNRVKSINDTYKSLPKLNFLPLFFEKYKEAFWLDNLDQLEAPLKDLSSQEQEQEQEQDQDQEQEQDQEQKQIQEQKKIIMSGKPDAYPQKENNFKKQNLSYAPKLSPSHLKSQALEILNFLNQKTGRAYRPVDNNLKLVIARLKSGVTADQCRQVIAKKTREWKNHPKMDEYLRPATLFNGDKFEQYFGELVLPANSEKTHD